MSKEAPPSRSSRRIVRWRLVGATLICLFILAATIPNLGRPEPITHAIRYGWPDALWILLNFVPLIIIFVGADRSPTAEGFGWAVLLVLLFLVLIFP
jgi:hypothetical protein